MRSLLVICFVSASFLLHAQEPSRFSDADSTETEETVEEKKSEQHGSSTTQSNQNKSSSTKQSNRGGMDKWRFGGMVGASFGTFTYLELSPRVHYLLQDNLAVGGGISYYYWKDNTNYPPGSNFITEGNVYGFSLFSWYNPIASLVLQGEFEPLNFEVYDFESNTYQREWVSGLLLGGGIRQQAGRANLFFVVLYNVLYDVNRTFYNSPWVIRIGVGI